MRLCFAFGKIIGFNGICLEDCWAEELWQRYTSDQVVVYSINDPLRAG
jgi:hypothetical protein